MGPVPFRAGPRVRAKGPEGQARSGGLGSHPLCPALFSSFFSGVQRNSTIDFLLGEGCQGEKGEKDLGRPLEGPKAQRAILHFPKANARV